MAKSEQLIPKVIPLSGKLIMAEDPAVIGENFQTLKNLRPVKDHLKGVAGMTKINTTVPTTYFKARAAHHFKKQQPVESHILVQEYNTGLTASQVLDNTTTPPTQGNFSSTALHTDATGAGTGRFSDAPGGNVAYCNGVEAMIYGGDESRIGQFANYNPDGSATYEVTEKLTNTLTDVKNTVVLKNATDFIGTDVKLMLHMDGTDGSTTFTDSSDSAHTVTAVGNAQIDTAKKKFGTAAGLFDGTGDYLTVPDNIDFDFSGGGDWSIDFWAYLDNATFLDSYTIYSQGTSTDGFRIYLVDNDGGFPSPSIVVTMEIRVAGVLTVSAGRVRTVTTGAWQHYELSHTDGVYYAFAQPSDSGTSVTDADVPANYTSTVYIGSSWGTTDFMKGGIDELRVSNGTGGHTEQFEPESKAYGDSPACYMRLGSTRPLSGFNMTMETVNTVSGTMGVDYWDGLAWVSVTTLSDGTISSGKSLAQTGLVTFDTTVALAKTRLIDKVFLYWYRIVISDGISATTEVSYVTTVSDFQAVTDIWDGSLIKSLSVMKFASSTFQDNSPNVFQDNYDSANTGTFMDISSLATATEYLVVGFTDRMAAVEFRFIGSSINTVTNSYATAYYWSGTAWVQLGLSDGTSEGRVSFGKSGVMSWPPPEPDTEFKRIITNAKSLYYYKIEFSKTLSSDVKLFHIAGIPAQKIIKGHKFPFFADNRLWLCSEASDKKNKVIVSAHAAPDVYNGVDSTEFEFGNDTELTGAAWLYSQIGSEVRSTKLFFKANETWIIEGRTPQNWRMFQLSDKVGCIAPGTIKTVSIGENEEQQVAIWQGARGLYVSDGRSISFISQDINQFFDDNASTSLNLSAAKDSAAFIDSYLMEYHWLFADGSNTTMNREFVYQILQRRWFEIVRGSGKELQVGLSTQDADGNEYAYGTIETGYMERLENGTDFDGTAIAHEFQTGGIVYENLMTETITRKVKLLTVAKTTTTNEATVTHYGDSSTTGTALDTFSPVSSGKRLASVIKSHKLGPNVLNSFKATMSTNNETIGFEPIAIGLFYQRTRKDVS